MSDPTAQNRPAADVAVIGAGAAGLMAAIMAARTAPTAVVLLFDGRQKVGAKILISGGTRCNVTHERVRETDYCGGPGHFIRHVLEAYTPAQTVQFFNELGVELVLESTGKLFPSTHSARTVLDALLTQARSVGVQTRFGIKVKFLEKTGEIFCLQDEEGVEYCARRVIVATGGLSLPETGSDGAGYGIAEHFGHTIVPTHPSLTPLETEDEDWKSLSGIALPAALSFYEKEKKRSLSQGPFLFTHFGYSGPAALDLSRHVSVSRPEDRPRVEADFISDFSDGMIEEGWASFYPQKSLKYALIDLFSLPERFVDVFLKKSGVDGAAVLRSIRKADLQRLIHRLRHVDLKVRGVVGYKKAEATAGGVSLKEVHFSSMQSRLAHGLYFAGEVLDVDGRIGGFNFQWAWSSGAIAGQSAAKSLQS